MNGRDEITGEMIKGGGNRVVEGYGDCIIWPLRVVISGIERKIAGEV